MEKLLIKKINACNLIIGANIEMEEAYNGLPKSIFSVEIELESIKKD